MRSCNSLFDLGVNSICQDAGLNDSYHTPKVSEEVDMLICKDAGIQEVDTVGSPVLETDEVFEVSILLHQAQVSLLQLYLKSLCPFRCESTSVASKL